METTPLNWHDAQVIGVEGRYWTDTEAPYDRLPAKAKGNVREVIWELSRSAIGMSLQFKSNAHEINVRWKLRNAQLNEPNFPRCGFSGLDLYALDKKNIWRWVGAAKNFDSQDPVEKIAEGLEPGEHTFLLYFPLRNPVERVEIGIPSGASFTPIPPRKEKPIVYYGTSIVHGAYASRPGMAHPAILSRKLNRPMLNLGFSGNAHMEGEIAALLTELPASLVLVDALPNMSPEMVAERSETFIRKLETAFRSVPIVLVEDRTFTNAWIKPGMLALHDRRRIELRKTYEKLKSEGFDNLYYKEGGELFGTDNEASLDGSHPSDLGGMRMAEQMEAFLRLNKLA